MLSGVDRQQQKKVFNMVFVFHSQSMINCIIIIIKEGKKRVMEILDGFIL